MTDKTEKLRILGQDAINVAMEAREYGSVRIRTHGNCGLPLYNTGRLSAGNSAAPRPAKRRPQGTEPSG